MTSKGIDVKCRKCGRIANSEKFVLDHTYKMMVCPTCVKERRYSEKMHSEIDSQKENTKTKSTITEENNLPSKKEAVDDTIVLDSTSENSDKQKISCDKCKYKFNYNTATKTPRFCPYCNAAVDNH
jgi:hypothetical protein